MNTKTNSPTPCRMNSKHPMCCDEHGGAFLNSKGEPTNRCAHASQSARIAELQTMLDDIAESNAAATYREMDRKEATDKRIAELEGALADLVESANETPAVVRARARALLAKVGG